MKNGSTTIYSFVEVNGIKTNSSFGDKFITLNEYYEEYFYNKSSNELQNKMEFIDNCFTYFRGGLDKLLDGENFVTLDKNEIIVHYDLVSNISDCESLIDSDNLNIRLYEDYDCSEESFIKEFKVVGLLKNYYRTSIGSSDVIDYQNKNLTGVSLLVTSLNGSDSDENLVKSLETFDNNGIRFSILNGSTSTFDMFEGIIVTTSTIFFYVALAFALFASLLLMNFISSSIAHKKREIGVLRALGARGSDIFGIFLNESTIISLINFALSSIATFVICKVTNALVIRKLGANLVLLNFGLRQLLLILVISWGTAFLASLIPSLKISKKRPIDAINNR